MSTATTVGDLTDRQMAIFRHLYEHARDRGFQPSLRELMAHFGIASPNGMVCHLKALEQKGWVARAFADGRAIRLLRTPSGEPFRGFADKPED